MHGFAALVKGSVEACATSITHDHAGCSVPCCKPRASDCPWGCFGVICTSSVTAYGMCEVNPAHVLWFVGGRLAQGLCKSFTALMRGCMTVHGGWCQQQPRLGSDQADTLRLSAMAAHVQDAAYIHECVDQMLPYGLTG